MAGLLCWLGLVGYMGYSMGRGPVGKEDLAVGCKEEPEVAAEVAPVARGEDVVRKLCDGFTGKSGDVTAGYTLTELRQQWLCSWSHAEDSQVHQTVPIKNGGKSKTKWQSILTMDPKEFATRYMPQYPKDTVIDEPVVVFSHKPLTHINELDEVCKVLDVAVIPDAPGTCVSVTETFHDVASYHMLHAERTPRGDFILAANAVQDRHVPTEPDYDNARGLLLNYFNGRLAVESAMTGLPRKAPKKDPDLLKAADQPKKDYSVAPIPTDVDVLGCLVDTMDELSLFKNSVEHAKKYSVRASTFTVFTTSGDVSREAKSMGCKVVYTPKMASTGNSLKVADETTKMEIRRFFLHSWFAFAASEAGCNILWQSPGTVWLSRPDQVYKIAKSAEVQWAYKGHGDARAAPFYSSFDFFLASREDRSAHLLHEILLHFDLVLAWGSLDTLSSYRLSENNSRYGTTSAMFAPYEVLHIDAMARKPDKIMAAAQAPQGERPLVIVFPSEGMTSSETKSLLQATGLWIVKP
jgi:ribosome modulation factor